MDYENELNEGLRREALEAKRKAARERQRKSRAKKKSQTTEAEIERIARECHLYRLVGAGELEPDVFARTTDEWLLCARRFAMAAGLPDVHDGESLNDFERRVYGAVCKVDAQGEWVMPLFSLKTRAFHERFESVNDEHINSARLFLPEHDAPIDVEKLEPLVTPRSVETARRTAARASVLYGGRWFFACRMPAGHSGPHELCLTNFNAPDDCPGSVEELLARPHQIPLRAAKDIQPVSFETDGESKEASSNPGEMPGHSSEMQSGDERNYEYVRRNDATS
jgi:hypothetical protein